ncbi:hypothetical protein M3Y95_00134200 [Aphelenchoides besseyi]|nr:hypothetical protein M3Y95_00134200 [Aphelenchoides besseyi]
MICRRHYPILIGVTLFVVFQLFLRTNYQSPVSIPYDVPPAEIRNSQDQNVENVQKEPFEKINSDEINNAKEPLNIENLKAVEDPNKKNAVDDTEQKLDDGNNVNKQNDNPENLQKKSEEKNQPLAAPKSSQGDVLFQPDEAEAKKGIAEDILNDENVDAQQANEQVPNEETHDLFVFPDDNEDADMYDLDYSKSHPFENTCRYPVSKRDEADLTKNVRHYRRVHCNQLDNQTIPMISQLPNGEILVGVPHRAKFRSGIKCRGRELSGTLRKHKRKLLEVGDWFEIPQDRRVLVNKDQFLVKCTDSSGKVLLTDVYTSLSDKPRLKPSIVENEDKYNIEIFVIDSTARNQFFRHMPLTMKFMRKKDFKFLAGHTKVGDNSAINLLPLLSGKVYDTSKRGMVDLVRDDMVITKKMLSEDFWKYSDMLIQIARDAGCATLWNDDIASVGFGLFNYYAFPGFVNPPADFYYRPYYMHLYSKLRASSSCVNGEFVVPRYIQIWERFARRFAKECHFSFNFMTGLTHASSSNLELYDQDLSASLDRMDRDGVLDNSFVFIMGDHGQRISTIQKTYTGRIEERMPLVSIFAPKKFREKYPEKMQQLEINQNRLTSNFDLHETLREIMQLSNEGREPVGRSVFGSIPTDRDCKDARVPVNFCMCQDKADGNILNSQEKDDIFDVLKSEVESFFAETSCIKSHTITKPDMYTPYTISVMSRIGIRYLSEWRTYLQKHKEPKLENHELFDIEFTPKIEIKTLKDKVVQLELRTRVFWDQVHQRGRLTATPLITNNVCGGIKLLEDVCRCNEM